MSYRTRAWSAVTCGARDAEWDESRAACTLGKCGQLTGDDLGTNVVRVPYQPAPRCCGTRMGSDAQGDKWGAGPHEGGSHGAGEELLRNRDMRKYRPHTDSETKTVTIKQGCGDTMIMHMGPGAGPPQGSGTDWPNAQRTVGANRRDKTRDPPHPDRPGARPARRWALCDGHWMRRRADTCGRELAPADEAVPPRAGAAWLPRMAPARPP